MPLKIRRKRINVPLTAQSIDYTIDGFGDVDAVIAITSGRDGGTDGNDTNAHMSVGWWDGTNQYSFRSSGKTAESTGRTNRGVSNTHLIGWIYQVFLSTTRWREWGRITGTVPNGVTITWDDDSLDNNRVDLIFIGGLNNVSMGRVDFDGVTLTEDVTTGHENHVVLFASLGASLADEFTSTTTLNPLGLAFYNGSTVSQAVEAFCSRYNKSTSQNGQIIRNDAVDARTLESGVTHQVAYSRLSGTQFRLTMSGPTPAAHKLYYLALELSDPAEFAMGIDETPALVGLDAISGMGLAPDFFGVLNTGLAAINTHYDLNSVYAHGMAWGFADALGEGSIGFRSRNTVGTMDEDCWSINASVLRMMGYDTTASAYEASIDSWDADGVTLDYSTLDATKGQNRQFIWIASGAPPAGGSFNETADITVAFTCNASETYTAPSYTETADITVAFSCNASETYTAPSYVETADLAVAFTIDASELFSPPGAFNETADITVAFTLNASETYTPPSFVETADIDVVFSLTANETFSTPAALPAGITHLFAKPVSSLGAAKVR